MGEPMRGLFLTWDDAHTADTIEQLREYDSDGDYSRVTDEGNLSRDEFAEALDVAEAAEAAEAANATAAAESPPKRRKDGESE